MPLATLVAEYAISFALAKPLRATGLHAGAAISPLSGVAAGGAFALLGIGFTVGGLMIVYNATQDMSLTVGYFVVRWVEGYLLTFILTAGVLGSLGLLPSAQAVAGASIAKSPQAVSGPFVRNDEGVELRFNGHQISIDWTRQTPTVETVGAERYPLAGAHVQLICFNGGEDLRRTATLQSGSDSVAWPLSQIPAATTQCEGYVMRIPHLGDGPPMSWSI